MRTVTIDKLTVGDTVTAIDGKPRPFPYEVTRVITLAKHGVTTVYFAHGGLIPPCTSKTTATVI